MQSFFANYRTTLWGVASIVMAVASFVVALTDNDTTTVPDVMLTMTAIGAGIGLINSRDQKVTSERSGAK